MLKNLLVLMFRRNISWVEIRQSAVARSVGTFGAPNNFLHHAFRWNASTHEQIYSLPISRPYGTIMTLHPFF